MKVITKKYSEHGINRIYQVLQTKKDNGGSPEFTIALDQIEVIPRTDELMNFYNFKNAMDEYVELVEFLIYNGKSHRYTTHRFIIEKQAEKKEQEINGLVESQLEQVYKTQELEQAKLLIDKQKKKIKKQKRLLAELSGKSEPLDQMSQLATMIVSAYSQAKESNNEVNEQSQEQEIGEVTIQRVDQDTSADSIKNKAYLLEIIKRLENLDQELQDQYWELALVISSLPELIPQFIDQINEQKTEENERVEKE